MHVLRYSGGHHDAITKEGVKNAWNFATAAGHRGFVANKEGNSSRNTRDILHWTRWQPKTSSRGGRMFDTSLNMGACALAQLE